MKKQRPTQKAVFTKADVDHLLADLRLYSGNIRSIDGLYGIGSPETNDFGGMIHTWMDSFGFSVFAPFCDEETWTIQLADPVGSLRHGHRSTVFFRFPKLHKDPALQERYALANTLYQAYNNYSNVTEASRIPRYEKALGYEGLPTYQHVLNAIIQDFRSFQQRRDADTKVQNAKN